MAQDDTAPPHWPLVVKAAAAAAVGATTAGTVTWFTYNLLLEQAQTARGLIGKLPPHPPSADGVYLPGGGPPLPWYRAQPTDTHLMIFGDSTAAGLGCLVADEVPGVRLARGLAEESGRRVRLSTKAISGASSKGLGGQVDAMLVAGKKPDAAVIMIGANDVTHRQSVGAAAARLGEAVARLRGTGAAVVVGTCPDLGVVTAIPQPLRTFARSRGLRLARAQAEAVLVHGGHPVPLADLLAPEFLAAPDSLFAIDRFHPSAAGYELAAQQLLPVLCTALGVWTGGPLEELPTVSAAAEARRPSVRAWEAVNRLWFRATNPLPLPGRGATHPFGDNAAAQVAKVAEAHSQKQQARSV